VEFATASVISIKYCVESRQDIELARNKAIENTNGESVVFINDDELPRLGTRFRSGMPRRSCDSRMLGIISRLTISSVAIQSESIQVRNGLERDGTSYAPLGP